MIGFIIVARSNSKRLTKKHFRLLNKRSVIENIILRLKKNFDESFEIILATTKNESDNDFNFLESHYNIKVYHGNNNIPLRLYKCAIKYQLESFVLIEGDDILFSIEAIQKTISKLKNKYQFTLTEGLPLGMNCYGFSLDFFKKNLVKFNFQKHLETNWTRVFNLTPTKIKFNQYKYYNKIRLTLDYKEDLMLFEKIFNHFKNDIFCVDYSKIIKFIIDNNHFKLNIFLKNEYESNATKEIKIESERKL